MQCVQGAVPERLVGQVCGVLVNKLSRSLFSCVIFNEAGGSIIRYGLKIKIAGHIQINTVYVCLGSAACKQTTCK